MLNFAAIKWIVDKWLGLPRLVQYFLGFLVIPNIVIGVLLFIFIAAPWIKSEIRASSLDNQARTEIIIKALDDKQNLRNDAIVDRLDRIDTHQNIMFQSILNGKK